MADIESNIDININTANALASLKALQNQISAFHASMAKGGAAAAATSSNMQQNLINSINSTGNFTANLAKIRTSTEAFTVALEKNKLSMGEYFRYAGASSKTFGKMFTNEFNTINKVARERVKDLQTQYIQMGRDANGAMQAIKVRPLTLDMNDLGTKTAIAAQKQQILNQLLKQGSTNLLNFGKNTQWAGRQLMVGFTLPLAMFAGKAIQSFQQVEEAALKFKRVYGDLGTTISETNDMSQKVQDLAASFTKYGVAVKDTLDMAATAAATGTQGKALLDQIKAATDLAVLGSVTQQQALQTTISLQNAFGISSDQLSKKINFLNAVENQTVLSIEDMTVAIPKAAPVVKQLGGNVEDLAFFLTAMKEGGINASEGANALKSGLSAMINPTNTASKMLMGYGINLRGIVNADKGNLKKTVVDFATALDKLDPLKRAKAIEQLFGKFQFARISTLMKNVVDQNSQAGKVLGLANAGPEALQILSEREKKTIENSPAYQYKKAMEDFQRQMVPIGLQFVKLITPVMEFVNKLLEQFNNLGDGTKSFVGGLVVVLGGIAPVALMAFGLISNGVANLIKMFANIKSFFNRTQTATQTLGETTNYLTQQQIEAAAVAASLEQSHMKLTQAFSSEAGAINQLTGAYERAILAQNAFRGTPGGPSPKPKGFATGGVIRGPGTGTSDSILAKLSNGEAVIPAKSVAKHPDLVNQLIGGNLPGYASGGIYSSNYTYKSKAQLEREAQLKAEREARLNTPEAKLAAKKAMSHIFLYNPSIAGELTKDNPVVKRMMYDQNKGPIYFVSNMSKLAFTGNSPELAMLRSKGLRANRYETVPLPLVEGLGKVYNVNEYGPTGQIVRKFATGGIIGKILSMFGGSKQNSSNDIVAKMRSLEKELPNIYVNFMRSNPELAIRMRSKDFLGKLASGDLQYRNKFAEPGTPESLLNDPKRLQIEQNVFGIPMDAPGNVRPIYGTAATTKLPWGIRGQSGTNASSFENLYGNVGSEYLDRYGDISLLLKNSVKKRSTFTLGDTFSPNNFQNNENKSIPAPFGTRNRSKILAAMSKGNFNATNFVEAQIFGGLSFDEVKKIIVQDPSLIPVLEQALAQAGLNVPVTMRKLGVTGRIAKFLNRNKTFKTGKPMFYHPFAKPGEIPPGYATGGMISGPGTGTSDSILARVSNGEAIIPAHSVAKHPQLVNQLISGNIPGFSTGGINQNETFVKGYKNAAMYLPEDMNTLMGSLSGKGAKTSDVTSYLKTAGGAAMSPLMAVMARSMGLKINDPQFKEAWSKIGAELTQTAINALDNSGKEFIKDLDIEDIVVPAMRETAKKLDLAGKEVGTAFDRAVDEIHTVGEVGGGGGTKGGKGRSPLSRLSYRTASRDAQKFAISENPEVYAKNKVASKSQASGFENLFQTKDTSGAWQTATMAHLAESVNMSVAAMINTVSSYVADAPGKIVKFAEKAGKKAFDVNSPSKVEEELMDDRVEGTVKGSREALPKMEELGREQAQAVLDGAAKVNGRRRVTTQSYNDAQEKAAAAQAAADPWSSSNKNPTNSRKRMTTYKDANGMLVVFNSKDPNDPMHPKNNPLSPENVQRINDAANSANPLLTPAGDYDAPIGPQLPPKEKEKLKDKLKNKLKGAKNYIASGAASRGIGSAVMMGSMASGMLPGELGAQAQQIMGPLMSVGMAFSMMPPQIAGIVTALGLLAYGLVKFDQDLRQAAQDGRDFSKSMTMTNDKLIAMSAVTQTVSATELRKAKDVNDILGVKNKKGQDSFGTQYLTTDAGTQMLDSIQTQLKNGQTWSAISSTLATQFSIAIQEGVLTDAQAKSIADGLGAKLKNYKLAIDINANLVGLVGGSIEQNATNTQESLRSQTNKLKENAVKAMQDAQNKSRGMLATGGLSSGTYLGAGISDTFFGGDSSGNKAADKAIAAATTATVAQIQNNQQLLDSINSQYDAKIKVAEANLLAAKGAKEEKKAQKELLDLQTKKTTAVEKQNKDNAKILEDAIAMQKNLESSGKATQFNDSIKASISNFYKDADPVTKAYVDIVSGKLNNARGGEFKTMLQVGFASGDISAATVDELLGLGKGINASGIRTNVGLLVKTVGNAQTDKILQTLSAAGIDKTNKPQLNLMTKIMATGTADEIAQKTLALAELVTRSANLGITLDLSTTSKAQQELSGMQKIIDNFGSDGAKKLTKKEFSLKLTKNPEFQGIYDQWDSLVGKNKTITVEAILNLQTSLNDPKIQQGIAEFMRGGMTKAQAVVAAIAAAKINLKDSGTGGGGDKSTDPNQTKVDKLQTKIDYYQAKIGRISDGLNILARSEDKINKKYDARLKALQDVQKINDKINKQKQGELDIANAISSGDMAAAARAALNLQDQTAQDNAANAQTQLEKNRQTALGSLVGPDGKTRIQSQKSIDALQEIIDKITYGQVDPLKIKMAAQAAGIKFANGGMVPKYFANGGFAMGTDTVPAMLTPGEFVIKKSSVDKIGVANLHRLNGYANGGVVTSSAVGGDSVYNYSINVNVATDANPNDIARTVMTQIRQIDNHRLRGNNL
jgi:TP901 family phage tail tape measure protein